MCQQGLYAQCETTQVKAQGKGAALFGYTKLYGQVPGGQAEYLRVPQAQFGPIKVPAGPPDDRFLFLSDVLPTAWQAVSYAEVPPGGCLAVFGLGPIGQMCVRIARQRGAGRIIAVDSVPERLDMARAWSAEVIDDSACDDVPARILDMTGGRGADSVIDAVGTEAHGDGPKKLMQQLAGLLPKPLSQPMTETMGVDRMAGLLNAIASVRRGGTLSIAGVYAGAVDPMPMMDLFDKGVQIRMGQAHVKRWVPDILPLLLDGDPLGAESFATHHVALADAPKAYGMFQKKQDGAIKIVFRP
jgi:threonine dehydrogenase-like Zn-dependent dehydrogenase